MQGLGTDGTPYRDPEGKITTFMHTGDPVTGTGWLDSYPGERWQRLASGPFEFARGDTQTIAAAKIVAWRQSNTGSVAELKNIVPLVQNFYDAFISKELLHNIDIKTNYVNSDRTDVFVNIKIAKPIVSVTAVLRDKEDNVLHSFELRDDGSRGDLIHGDDVFTGTVSLEPAPTPHYLGLQLTTVGSITHDFDKLSRVTTSGPLTVPTLHVVSDHLNQDGVINPGESIRLSADLWNGSNMDFNDVTALYTIQGPVDSRPEIFQLFCDALNNAVTPGDYAPGDPKTYVQCQVSPTAMPGDSLHITIDLKDKHGNYWMETHILQIEEFSIMPGELTEIEHMTGTGDGSFYYRVVDPVQLMDHQYEIHINEPATENDTFSFNLIDQTAGERLLENAKLPDDLSHHIPVIHGFRVFGKNLTTEPPRTFNWVRQTTDADTTGPGLEDLDHWFHTTGVPADIRQRDIEMRFTGTTDTGDNSGVVTSGGSMGTQWELAALYSVVTDAYAHVPVRLPFEIWDIENDRQINCAVFNRNRDHGAPYGDYVGDPDTPGMEPRWRISGGDYFMPIFSDYDENATHTPNDSLASWTLYFSSHGDASWTAGDVLLIHFVNVLTTQDTYQFEPKVLGFEDGSNTSRDFVLYQNYPNPFNPRTRIQFQLEKSGHVEMNIYNMRGRHVKQLLDATLESGSHHCVWDATDASGAAVSSGLYFYELKTDQLTDVHKMILLR